MSSTTASTVSPTATTLDGCLTDGSTTSRRCAPGLDALFQLDERAVVLERDDLAAHDGAGRVLRLRVGPGILADLLRPSDTRSVSALNFNTFTRTWSPTWNSSDGCVTRPHDMSVMWSRPSMPPRSMKAVLGEVLDDTLDDLAFLQLLERHLLSSARSFSRSTRRDSTMLRASC